MTGPGRGVPAGAAIALNTLGWCLTQLGRHREALECSRQALGVLQETGHRGGEAARVGRR